MLASQFGGMKQLENKNHEAPQLPESYLLCRECDGTWVDARDGQCSHCTHETTSRDFHLCLACALREHRCQHCGDQMHIRITTC